MLEVGAAMIQDGEKFLACQRPAHKTRALQWEFVGGKVEAGETGAQALIRECMEELGVTLCVGDSLMDVIHEYADLTVHLTLYSAVGLKASVMDCVISACVKAAVFKGLFSRVCREGGDSQRKGHNESHK